MYKLYFERAKADKYICLKLVPPKFVMFTLLPLVSFTVSAIMSSVEYVLDADTIQE